MQIAKAAVCNKKNLWRHWYCSPTQFTCLNVLMIARLEEPLPQTMMFVQAADYVQSYDHISSLFLSETLEAFNIWKMTLAVYLACRSIVMKLISCTLEPGSSG